MAQAKSGSNKNAAFVMAAHFALGFGRFFVLGVYILWALSVLKYSNATASIDARELIVIYPLSGVGLVFIVSAARKKVMQWLQG